jgi:hypothetical protein
MIISLALLVLLVCKFSNWEASGCMGTTVCIAQHDCVLLNPEKHVYLCSFFLQLTLLDLECSMLPASLLAAASLANSLEVYGKDVWPAIVQQYSAYTLVELTKARRQIQAVRLHLTAAGCSLLMLTLKPLMRPSGTGIIPGLPNSDRQKQQTLFPANAEAFMHDDHWGRFATTPKSGKQTGQSACDVPH